RALPLVVAGSAAPKCSPCSWEGCCGSRSAWRLGCGSGLAEGGRGRRRAGAPPSLAAGGRRAGHVDDLCRLPPSSLPHIRLGGGRNGAAAPADGSIRSHPGRATSSSWSGPAPATRARSSSGAASSSLGRRSSRGIGSGCAHPQPNRQVAHLPRPLAASASSSAPQASAAATSSDGGFPRRGILQGIKGPKAQLMIPATHLLQFTEDVSKDRRRCITICSSRVSSLRTTGEEVARALNQAVNIFFEIGRLNVDSR
ncbi:unnamed protein product, partial [Urochloa humidicola]